MVEELYRLRFHVGYTFNEQFMDESTCTTLEEQKEAKAQFKVMVRVVGYMKTDTDSLSQAFLNGILSYKLKTLVSKKRVF